MQINASLFNEYNKKYAKSAGVLVIPSIRVEQGEYAVASINISLGTYNMHQCVVLYMLDKDKGLHGLAHIDGHTEISSLNDFFDNFGYSSVQCHSQNNLSIMIYRDATSDSVGLNNPELNFRKTVWALRDLRYSVEDKKLPDFVINNLSMRIKGLPQGFSSFECKATHFLQQIKRNEGYLGTYPLIKACNIDDYFYVTLDQRSFLSLDKMSKNTIAQDTNDVKSLGGGVAESNEVYNEAAKYIEYLKNLTLKQIEKCSNNSRVVEIINRYNVPINIPDDDACSSNQKFVTCLNVSLDVEKCINNFVIHFGNVDEAISIARRYDPYLNIEQIEEFIVIHYGIPQNQLKYHQYDAIITAFQFNQALKFANSTLYEYTIINGQGYLEAGFISIEDAIKAAKIIDLIENSNFVDGLKCSIEKQNNYAYLTFQNSYPQNALELLPSMIDLLHDELLNKIYSRRELLKINILANSHQNYKTVEDFFQKLSEINKNNQNFEILKENALTKLSLLLMQKLHSIFLYNDDKYRYIQTKFLEFIEPLDINKFNDLTISKTISFPNYSYELESKSDGQCLIEEIELSSLYCQNFFCSSLTGMVENHNEFLIYCYS